IFMVFYAIFVADEGTRERWKHKGKPQPASDALRSTWTAVAEALGRANQGQRPPAPPPPDWGGGGPGRGGRPPPPPPGGGGAGAGWGRRRAGERRAATAGRRDRSGPALAQAARRRGRGDPSGLEGHLPRDPSFALRAVEADPLVATGTAGQGSERG